MDFLDGRAASASDAGLLGLFSIGSGSLDNGDSCIFQQGDVCLGEVIGG